MKPAATDPEAGTPRAALAAVLQALRAQNAPASHLERLDDVVAWAEHDARVRAIVLVGSYAQGRGDRLSDLDLAAFVAPGSTGDVLQTARTLLSRQPLVQMFEGQPIGHGAFCKCVYLDFASVEFHVFEADRPFGLKRPYLPVWDPAACLPGRVVDGPPIAHEDFSLYDHGDAGLLWAMLDCIKWLSRGRVGLTRHHLLKLADDIRRTKGPGAVGAVANEHDLVILEQRRTRALVERDWPMIEALHVDGYQLVTPAGQVLDREAYFSLLRAAPFYTAWDIEATQARLSPTMATLRYRARLHFPSGRVMVAWHTDHYERTDRGWQAVWSQATAITPPQRQAPRPN